jgi:hypothetical protein
MSEWRTIESAPRDGTHILLYARDCGSQSECDIQIGFYLGMRFGTLFINNEEWTGWLSVSTYDNGHGDSENEHLTPTHWMPLPEAPKVKP